MTMAQMQLTTTADGGSTEAIRADDTVHTSVRLAVGTVQAVLAGEDLGVFAGTPERAVAALTGLAMVMMVRSAFGNAEILQLQGYLLNSQVRRVHASRLDADQPDTAEVWQAYRAFVEETFAGACRTDTAARVARRLNAFPARVRMRAAAYAVATFAVGEMSVYGEEVDDFEFYWEGTPNPAETMTLERTRRAS